MITLNSQLVTFHYLILAYSIIVQWYHILFSQTCRVVPGVVGTCCPGVTEACQCEAPSGDPLSIGDSFYPNITSISSAQPQCIVCTCVGMGSETPYLQCYEPVCPSVIGCPEDKLYYPESSSCCPLCRESVNHDCTGESPLHWSISGVYYEYKRPSHTYSSTRLEPS